jgi:hypothetical protein
MAKESTIGGNGTLFAGENKTLRFEVLDTSLVPVDMSGWTVVFDARYTDSEPAPALVSLSATIAGAYSATRSANAQRASVALTPAVLSAPGSYRYALTRTDSGFVTVIAFGWMTVEKATKP